MVTLIAKIKKYPAVSVISLLSMLFVLGGSLWAYASLATIGSGPFILHYNDIDGITQLGGLDEIAFMGFLGVVTVFLTFFIALALEERDRVLGKMLAVGTLLASVLLFIAFVAILNVN